MGSFCSERNLHWTQKTVLAILLTYLIFKEKLLEQLGAVWFLLICSVVLNCFLIALLISGYLECAYCCFTYYFLLNHSDIFDDESCGIAMFKTFAFNRLKRTIIWSGLLLYAISSQIYGVFSLQWINLISFKMKKPRVKVIAVYWVNGVVGWLSIPVILYCCLIALSCLYDTWFAGVNFYRTVSPQSDQFPDSETSKLRILSQHCHGWEFWELKSIYIWILHIWWRTK